MGLYPFILDCRTLDEKKNCNFSENLFCKGTSTTLNMTSSIDCLCDHHKLIKGNKFRYDISKFYRDHNYDKKETIDVEVVNSVKIRVSWGDVIIIQFLTNHDLSDVKNIRYYTYFENEDTPSIFKRSDGLYMITLPFDPFSIERSKMSNEDYRMYDKIRMEEEIFKMKLKIVSYKREINILDSRISSLENQLKLSYKEDIKKELDSLYIEKSVGELECNINYLEKLIKEKENNYEIYYNTMVEFEANFELYQKEDMERENIKLNLD